MNIENRPFQTGDFFERYEIYVQKSYKERH